MLAKLRCTSLFLMLPSSRKLFTYKFNLSLFLTSAEALSLKSEPNREKNLFAFLPSQSKYVWYCLEIALDLTKATISSWSFVCSETKFNKIFRILFSKKLAADSTNVFLKVLSAISRNENSPDCSKCSMRAVK